MRISKPKTWFSEKIDKIGKPLARLTKKKRKIQIIKIKNERGDIATDFEKKIIIKEYYAQLHANTG